jgi:N-acetylglutamate synthase-like GNAT family acetyltransferase
MNNIRQASESDIPRILQLYEELTEEKLKVSPQTIQRVFAEISALPNQQFLVVEKDNFVVGTLFLQITPNLSHDARPWAVLENLVVDRRYNRHGFGRQLIEHALAVCRKSGCYKVQLLSSNKRKEAHQFYRSMGFKESAVGFRLYL